MTMYIYSPLPPPNLPNYLSQYTPPNSYFWRKGNPLSPNSTTHVYMYVGNLTITSSIKNESPSSRLFTANSPSVCGRAWDHLPWSSVLELHTLDMLRPSKGPKGIQLRSQHAGLAPHLTCL